MTIKIEEEAREQFPSFTIDRGQGLGRLWDALALVTVLKALALAAVRKAFMFINIVSTLINILNNVFVFINVFVNVFVKVFIKVFVKSLHSQELGRLWDALALVIE